MLMLCIYMANGFSSLAKVLDQVIAHGNNFHTVTMNPFFYFFVIKSSAFQLHETSRFCLKINYFSSPIPLFLKCL